MQKKMIEEFSTKGLTHLLKTQDLFSFANCRILSIILYNLTLTFVKNLFKIKLESSSDLFLSDLDPVFYGIFFIYYTV